MLTLSPFSALSPLSQQLPHILERNSVCIKTSEQTVNSGKSYPKRKTRAAIMLKSAFQPKQAKFTCYGKKVLNKAKLQDTLNQKKSVSNKQASKF
ncbi:hypothetical protein SAMD00079811_44150 [Scytonema sp. HK-05]|nr:hypothetical protein NIES2130_33990 [Scytonema sp. HK-05]BAY46802.1 hypothetical protein SAMD00079811_44150 [Scytonema sp. HK-05]